MTRLKRGSEMSGPSETAFNSQAARSPSPGVSAVVILVSCLTLVPFWNYYGIWGCGSIMHLYSDYLSVAKNSMDCAGAALITAVMIWRRAGVLGRYVLGLCGIANLLTLFVVTWQRLGAVGGH